MSRIFIVLRTFLSGASGNSLKGLLMLLFLALATKVNAQPHLFDLSLSAEKMILGTISKVEDHHFYLEYIEGSKKQRIRVAKWKYTAQSPRFAPYTPGQKLLAFISYYNGDFRLLDGGAELPLIKDSVVIPMSYFTPKVQQALLPQGAAAAKYKEQQTFIVAGKPVFGLRFQAIYLYRNMLTFRKCYQIILKKDPLMAGPHCFNFFDRLTADRLNAAKRSSTLVRLLYNDMEEAQKVNCRK